MNPIVIDNLKSIVGNEHISNFLARFLRAGQNAPGITMVSPGNTGEVRDIVKLAQENKVGIVTCNDHYLLEEDLDREGLLLEFSRMDQIERIDPLNLMVHIYRGVTWDQLNAELIKHGIRAAAPVAANSKSVAECAQARVMGKAANKYPDYFINNMNIVLADGSLHKSGSHCLNEEGADGRHEGGPCLSSWYNASDDIFGVMTRATIMLWPVRESRTCQVYAFEDYDQLLNAMKEIPRSEVGVEYFALNQAAMRWLLGGNGHDFPVWSMVVGFEGRAEHVAHHEENMKKMVSGYKCEPVDSLTEAMTEELDKPWMEASPNHTAFFSLFSRMKEFDATVDKAAKKAGVSGENVGKMLVSFDHGRAVYAVYDWFGEDDLGENVGKMNLDMADKGAFFDRPHGELARKIFSSIPNHLPLLKKVKNILDPENIMNPGRTIRDEDKEWQPLSVGDGTTGITITNVKHVREKLGEAIGAEWVSDNPADLNSYSRDFTIFSGERPNIVVLPRTTGEVQSIIRIAYEHGIPIVPMSTGFNHGGLTVTRKGGIMVDLKRMDEPCELDEESMTITVGPGVRMRSTWWEAIKRRAGDPEKRSHLKSILALTLGSVSLLSNYVARGGAGTAFKYGGNVELTVNMTWVLPNGEIFKIGPGAIPNVGKLPIHYCPGPELNGMFFNADGLFGICTELTAKLYPEPDNVDDLEIMMTAANPDPDHNRAFDKTIDCIYELSRENITDFMYKSHPGVMALGMQSIMDQLRRAGSEPPDLSIDDLLLMSSPHPLMIMVSGYDEQDAAIKKKIVEEITAKHDMNISDPDQFGPELRNLRTTANLKKSLGIKGNTVGAHKGAFQWTACGIKMEKIPSIAREYDKLVQKYWKSSDPAITVEHAMTGTDIQGPLQYGRCGTCEFDWWWDQGNPESVKRAAVMMHKTNKLMLKHGGILFRNMFGSGEYHLPMWGIYFTILKRFKKAFDPANLMHPDVLPITEDYV